MTDKVRLRRVMAGSYETPDGRFAVYRDTSRMAGWMGSPWVVTRDSAKVTEVSSLRAARRWLAREAAR